MSRTRLARLLCSLAATVLATVGLAAIVMQTHTGSARRLGMVTLEGDAAVRAGIFLLCLALLPLAVWLPRRWLGPALFGWWLALMALLAWTLQQPPG